MRGNFLSQRVGSLKMSEEEGGWEFSFFITVQ